MSNGKNVRWRDESERYIQAWTEEGNLSVILCAMEMMSDSCKPCDRKGPC